MTFVAPLFLAGVLAGLLPVLLHLIHRRKAPDTPFSTLRFLRLSVQRTRRRKILDDAALLALRVAVLALLAVGLANPVITSLQALWGPGRTTAVAIILDNSMSMATVDGGKPRLETARKAAEQILDLLREGDAVAFLPTGGPPSAEHGKLYLAHETVRQALARCRVSHERADFAARLQQARALLAQSDAPNREIYVLTDNQALSWEGLKEPEAEGQGPRIPVVVVHVNREPAPNLALRGVRLETPAPAVGVPITAAAEVVNPSTVPQTATLELHLDGRKQAVSPTLNLTPGGAARHTFRFTLDSPGVHRGEVRLAEEDGCPLDNRRFFVVTVGQQISVAVVVPRRHPVAYADDSFYLERVLAPAEAEGWAIRPRVLTAENLVAEPLHHHAVVFLVNLPAPDAAVAGKLRDYVEAGGHLFWVCGDNVDPDAYNRMNEKADYSLLPATLGLLREAAAGKESWKVAALDRDHPALRGLTEPPSLYQSVVVHRHFPLTVKEGVGARVLAQLEGEQPLLVEQRVGRGSVLLLGTGAHVDWTNLPLRPIFLPLMARLTFRLAGAETESTQALAGAPLVVPLPAGAESAEVEITTPAGEILRVQAKNSGRGFRYADTHEVGTYLFRLLNAKEARPLAFAVNGDPDESDAATLTAEELTRRLGREVLVYVENPEEVTSTVRRLREGESLWSLFLAAALACLMLEAYIANCRGRKPPGAEPPALAGRASRVRQGL
jgi:hypothetical protein